MNRKEHITVCICTFKRPAYLSKLLNELQIQETGGQFSYSIVVVDNDVAFSAQETVHSLIKSANVHMQYFNVPEQNISLARNKALEVADGEYIAFIDDDEFPTAKWLFSLYRAVNEYKVDGVIGPVIPYFEKTPPSWIIQGRICERRTFPTGKHLHWTETRTGNVLFSTRIFQKKNLPVQKGVWPDRG